MNPWTYLAIHDAAGFAAGAYLAANNCPWWAGVCFIMVCCTNYTVRAVK